MAEDGDELLPQFSNLPLSLEPLFGAPRFLHGRDDARFKRGIQSRQLLIGSPRSFAGVNEVAPLATAT